MPSEWVQGIDISVWQGAVKARQGLLPTPPVVDQVQAPVNLWKAARN